MEEATGFEPVDHFRSLRFSRALRSTGLCHASMFGAPTRDRIWNPPIKSRMLCQLSYKRKMVWVAGFEPAASWIRTRHSGQTELHPDKWWVGENSNLQGTKPAGVTARCHRQFGHQPKETAKNPAPKGDGVKRHCRVMISPSWPRLPQGCYSLSAPPSLLSTLLSKNPAS